MNITRFIAAGLVSASLMVGSLQKVEALGVSNLGAGPFTVGAVSSESWQATQFTTGNQGLTFILNSVTISLDLATGDPTGFSLGIYSDASGAPDTLLYTLTAINPLDDPAVAGNYAFSATGPAILTAGTDYWVGMGATSLAGDGTYSWNYPDPGQYDGDLGWSINDLYGTSNDGGATWFGSGLGGGSYAIAIDADVVPEPSAYALFLFGAVVIVWQIRRKQASLNA